VAVAGRSFIGTFRLTKVLYVSKMCQVWDAVRDSDEQPVVLKVLKSKHKEDKKAVESLKFEYQVGKPFKHPRVIRTLDYGEDRGVHYMVLQRFSPRSMKQAIRDDFTALMQMMPKVVEQAAEGLSYMHHRGWLHCDVKPDNYLVAETGDVKLIDFSIAQKMKKLRLWPFAKSSTVQGTMSYMSPEQIRGERLDERADLYCFGCLLYELVTGKLPYTAESSQKLLSRHLKANVPSASAHSEATPEFSDLIGRMMSKQKDDRPESMEAFLKEFRKLKLLPIRLTKTNTNHQTKPCPPQQGGTSDNIASP